MGTTRIKVIDLSAEVEQIKTSRKRAQTAAVREIKKPLIKEKKKVAAGSEPRPEGREKPQKVAVELETRLPAGQVSEKIEKQEILPEKEEVPKQKVTQRRGKKYQNAKLLTDPAKFYPADIALELVKKINVAKFDGKVEAHILVKQKGVRGSFAFPHPFGNSRKILIFASRKVNLPKPDRLAGGDGILLGNEKTIEEIEARKLVPKKDFNLVISTPEFMPKLAGLGKFLGPAGLMPNPKSGTVTDKPEEVIKKFSAGTVEFKTESQAPVIHLPIGKLSQNQKQLKENLMAVITAVNPQKIVKLYLAPTMGPSIKVDLSSLQ